MVLVSEAEPGGGARFSYPRCSVSSAPSARSSKRFFSPSTCQRSRRRILIHSPRGVGTEQPTQTGLEGIIAPPPAGRQASGILVLLQHLGVKTTFSPIDACAEPGNAATDDNNLMRSLSHAPAAPFPPSMSFHPEASRGRSYKDIAKVDSVVRIAFILH